MDIRLDVDFFNHPKVIKLERRLGLEGLKALLVLWTWCARNRSDGDLQGMDAEDIEIAAEWRGESGLLAQELVSLRWLDIDDNKHFSLHEWSAHQPWVSDAETRSDKARFSRLSYLCPEIYPYLVGSGINFVTKDQFQEIKSILSNDNQLAQSEVIERVLSVFDDKNITNNDTLTVVKRSLNNRTTPSPSPSPSPTPHVIEKNSEGEDEHAALMRKRDTMLAIIEAGERGKQALGTGTAEQKPPLRTQGQTEADALRLFRVFPGHRGQDEESDRRFLSRLQAMYLDFDLTEELRRVSKWVLDHQETKVRNSRAFIRDWFKKTRTLRENLKT